jgi:hypothetical protein
MEPENLSRALAGLSARGVQVDGTSVRQTDLSALAKPARLSPLMDDPMQAASRQTGRDGFEPGSVGNARGRPDGMWDQRCDPGSKARRERCSN